MLTFDEFFKKKRIDTAALQKAEPALFSEFKTHYEQMGEKSFDHTKKYWFNKTRRQFPLAPEQKTEKLPIANPIAEQTITESLTEHAAPAPAKMGFTPKFRAGTTVKTVEKPAETPAAEQPAAPQPEEKASTKPAGFVPRFKMKPKVEEDELTPPVEPAAESAAPLPESPAKPAYKPRFVPPKPKVDIEDVKPVDEIATPQETSEKKPAYKPRFVPPKKTGE